jgi:hypothetical protein
MRDLRIPIGSFFSLAGAIVTITGLATGDRARLEPANINLYCGGAILAFGLILLWLARRRSI